MRSLKPQPRPLSVSLLHRLKNSWSQDSLRANLLYIQKCTRALTKSYWFIFTLQKPLTEINLFAQEFTDVIQLHLQWAPRGGSPVGSGSLLTTWQGWWASVIFSHTAGLPLLCSHYACHFTMLNMVATCTAQPPMLLHAGTVAFILYASPSSYTWYERTGLLQLHGISQPHNSWR